MIDEAVTYYKPDLIALPETFNYRGLPVSERDQSEQANDSASLNFLKDLAAKYSVAIMSGSHLLRADSDKPYNTAHYIDAKGNVLATYSKAHLFDVNLKSGSVSESANRCAGDISSLNVFSDVIAGSEINMAMSICYDLRFPELYRHYMFNCTKEPDIIFVPSAFSYETGKAHWETLLRARAIENSVYVVAPNQIGRSDSGFECYGNSMVIDPWGQVLARATGSSPQILNIEIDLFLVAQVRKRLPLDNKRLI
jgi:predicted amidohydrolase